MDVTNSSKSDLVNASVTPRDRFNLIFTLFFLLGLVNVLPWSVFITAHEYWMYKLRDLHSGQVPASGLTNLQTEFSPALTITLNVASVTATFVALFYGHRFGVNFKLFVPLCVNFIFYAISTVFIEVDTDAWQREFFGLTMTFIAIINGSTAFSTMNNYTIISMFPSDYLSSYYGGQALAVIFTSCLQILSLAVGFSVKSSAFIYFGIATAMVGMSLFISAAVARYNTFYKFYMSHAKNEGNVKRTMISWKETVDGTKKIWPSLAASFLYLLTVYPVHTSITSLVVSEGAGRGIWNDVYFVPVATFLLNAVGDFLGRTIAANLKFINVSGRFLTIFSGLRVLIFVPLLMLCNAHPRYNLPVAFPHDYQYIIIMAVFALTNGYLMSMCGLIIPKLVAEAELENAYHIYVVGTEIMLGLFCFIPYVFVKLL